MSLCVRSTAAAAAAASKRLSTVCWAAVSFPISAQHLWRNATSFPSASCLFNSHSSSPSSSPSVRRFSSTASTASTSPPSSSEPALLSVRSMSELRDVVEHAGNNLVILEWKATWCNKCKTVAKDLLRLQARHPTLTIRTVDIEEGDLGEGKREAGIDHIPVVHFIKGGELVHEIVGVRTNEMTKTVEKYVGEQAAASS